MTERRYTLGEVTGAMGEALKRLPARERINADRALRMWSDGVVDQLKAMAVDAAPEAGHDQPQR